MYKSCLDVLRTARAALDSLSVCVRFIAVSVSVMSQRFSTEWLREFRVLLLSFTRLRVGVFALTVESTEGVSEIWDFA